MTANELRQKLVATAKAYLGCKESDGSHRKIIDIYNGHKPLARSYKVKYTDAWCSTYVSAMSILCGMTTILPTECGCGKHIDLFKKLDSWVESDAYVPTAGDVIFYSWNDSGIGECSTGASHVGIVTSCDGRKITVIEGNISNSVGYRTLDVNGRYIRGYGVPKYEKLTKEEAQMRYNTLADLKADKTYGDAYLPTVEKLMEKGILRGKGGEGDETVIDLGEDAIRVLVMLDRAGKFD